LNPVFGPAFSLAPFAVNSIQGHLVNDNIQHRSGLLPGLGHPVNPVAVMIFQGDFKITFSQLLPGKTTGLHSHVIKAADPQMRATGDDMHCAPDTLKGPYLLVI